VGGLGDNIIRLSGDAIILSDIIRLGNNVIRLSNNAIRLSAK